MAAPRRRQRYVIGVDEVGRGPLAGPVVVAAVAVPISWRPAMSGGRADLRDSKKMTFVQRELWHAHLTAHPRINFAIAKCFPKRIDEVNIARAANNSARSAVRKLISRLPPNIAIECVYLDGGLYLQKLRHPRKKAALHTEEVLFDGMGIRLTAHTVVRGDDRFPAVKAASVIAKVHRDRLMNALARQYPGYGFEVHKGYATKTHREAIRKLGPSKAHRLTFLMNSATIS